MVPGALEVPQVLAAAIDAGLFSEKAPAPFHGLVALGCVIRGETSHYDIVAGKSARALIALINNLQHSAGKWELIVENEEQAIARASVSGEEQRARCRRGVPRSHSRQARFCQASAVKLTLNRTNRSVVPA